MARLYADEQFPKVVVELLRTMGHDVLTVQEAGKANQKISDEEVLSFATCENRAVMTLNRRHFVRLHGLHPNHAGIIVCTSKGSLSELAINIHQAIAPIEILTNQLIRVYKSS